MNDLITLEYNAHPIHFTGEAYVNLTEMGKPFRKLPNEFLRLPETKRYIAALEASLNRENPGSNEVSNCGIIPQLEPVLLTRTGRRNSGTWAHPDLAMEFARWLSPEFSIWCNRTIRKILLGEFVSPGSPVALPPSIERLIRPDRLQNAREWHGIMLEIDSAGCEKCSRTKGLGRKIKEIAARYATAGRKGFGEKSIYRKYQRWTRSNRHPISVVRQASIHAEWDQTQVGGKLASLYKRERLTSGATLQIEDQLGGS